MDASQGSVEEPEDDVPDSRTQGACVLVVAALGVGVAVFTYSRDVFVLLVWAIGAAAVWYAVRKPVSSTANPAPPAPSERGSGEEPQVSIMRDSTHPNRWLVNRPSHWMTEEIDKEAGTT